LRLSIYGMAIEWEEQPFEWVRPFRFGVVRNYTRGPMVELRALAELTPRPEGGTTLKYSVWTKPRSWRGAIARHMQLRLTKPARSDQAFRNYDELATTSTVEPESTAIELSDAGRARVSAAKEKLLADGVDEHIVDRLIDYTLTADDFSVAHIRPY